MLTSKQRAYLRGLANGIDPIFQIGKDGIGENQVVQLADALEARELIKIRVLENALADPRVLCSELCERLSAQPVQVIGSCMVLYKESKKKKTIVL